MKTLTRESIAALSGRDLDAAVHRHAFGVRMWDRGPWNGHWCDKDGANAPEYTHPDCRGLAEMIAAARERGWKFRSIEQDDGSIAVILVQVAGRAWLTGFGSTLPEAFARALLLTTLTEATP